MTAGRLAAAALIGAAAALAAVGPSVAEIEARFAELVDLKDQIDVAHARGLAMPPVGERYARARAALAAQLAASPPPADPDHVLDAIKGRLEEELPPEPTPPGEKNEAGECHYDAAALAKGPQGLEALTTRMYECFGAASRALPFGAEALDRLTIFERLGSTGDPAARKRLFLAWQPLWRSVNGDGGPGSPFRVRLRLAAERREGESYAERNAAALGVDPALVEGWLVSALERWREALPAAPIEPWDYWYAAGAAERALGPKLPLDRLGELNGAFYRALGADPERLRIHFDLAPREGKTPVAFTTFGRRPSLAASAAPGEAWVFATYRSGGLGNLVELLHETGHGIHIMAIRTRPAFASWPDSDTFTESLGDLLALEAYEPEWQRRWLGAAAGVSESMRAKYASVVLDMAWTLFELRLARNPAADPNQVWTQLTRDYLRVAPHPEWSWWAIRGQLVDAPGYMMNYGLGAILVADLRARARELKGTFANPDPTWYPWLSQRLYRFGLERSSRDVIAGYLERPPRPDALLADMARGARRP